MKPDFTMEKSLTKRKVYLDVWDKLWTVYKRRSISKLRALISMWARDEKEDLYNLCDSFWKSVFDEFLCSFPDLHYSATFFSRVKNWLVLQPYPQCCMVLQTSFQWTSLWCYWIARRGIHPVNYGFLAGKFLSRDRAYQTWPWKHFYHLDHETCSFIMFPGVK